MHHLDTRGQPDTDAGHSAYSLLLDLQRPGIGPKEAFQAQLDELRGLMDALGQDRQAAEQDLRAACGELADWQLAHLPPDSRGGAVIAEAARVLIALALS